MKPVICICCGSAFPPKRLDSKCQNPNLCSTCASASREHWANKPELEPQIRQVDLTLLHPSLN